MEHLYGEHELHNVIMLIHYLELDILYNSSNLA
jgi:hypothetical protein